LLRFGATLGGRQMGEAMPPDMPDSSDRLAILFSGENLPRTARNQRGTGAALWNARNKRQIWVGFER